MPNMRKQMLKRDKTALTWSKRGQMVSAKTIIHHFRADYTFENIDIIGRVL